MPIKINGLNTGSVTLSASASGGDVILNLPNSNGTVATTSYADSAPGLQYITSSTFSAVSSVSVNNCFTSIYDNYRIVLSCTSSSGYEIYLRLRLSGTDNTTSNYHYQDLQLASTTFTGFRSINQTSAMVAALSTSYQGLSIEVFNPALAIPTSYHTQQVRQANSTPELRFDGGGHNVSTAYDGFTLFTTVSPVTTMTGNLRVYGYRNS